MYTDEAIDILNISYKTLIRRVKDGTIRATKNGKKLVLFEDDVYKLAGKVLLRSNWITLYVRVSKDTRDKRAKMAEQIERLTDWAIQNGYTIDKVYEDYCPSTEWRYGVRTGLWQLVNDCMSRKVHTVIVESVDRIATNGWEMFPVIFKKYGIDLVVINKGRARKEFLDEASEDIARYMENASADIKNGQIKVDQVKFKRAVKHNKKPEREELWPEKVVPSPKDDLSDLI